MEGLLIPIEDYITGNEKIQIKETREGKKLILECENKTEYYCPYCGSYFNKKTNELMADFFMIFTLPPTLTMNWEIADTKKEEVKLPLVSSGCGGRI